MKKRADQRFASRRYWLKNNLVDGMIKQLLNLVIAKYRDLSVSRRSIICLSVWLWQIIDLLATDKSRYFAQPRSIIVSHWAKASHHLQCTNRNKLLMSFPQKFLASQLYSPAWLLWILIRSRASPSVRLPVLTFVQDTDGTGFPLTLQVRFQFSASTTVMLLRTWIVLPAIKKEN